MLCIMKPCFLRIAIALRAEGGREHLSEDKENYFLRIYCEPCTHIYLSLSVAYGTFYCASFYCASLRCFSQIHFSQIQGLITLNNPVLRKCIDTIFPRGSDDG